MSATVASPEIPAAGYSATAIFFSLLVPALVSWYVYYRATTRRFVEMGNKLPGPPGLPLIGSALELTGTAPDIFKRVYGYGNEYQDVAKFWAGNKLLVFLMNPKDVELILGSNVHLDKAPEYRFFKPWLGNGLLISSGEHWRSHRKLIAPTFHLNVLKSFVALFNQNARDVCDKMNALAGKEFDCHDYMSECTVEILLETAMGVNKKTQDKSGFEYAMAVMKMCNILHLRHTKLWLRPDFIFNVTKYRKEQESLLNVIHSLTKKVIKKKKEEWNSGIKTPLASISETEKPEPAKTKSSERAATEHSYGQAAGLKDDLDVDDNDVGEKKRMAFLDLMIESAQNGVVMNDTDIKEEVDTIMFEGHDTTAAGSSFFLSLMGLHKDVQERVVQELDEIFGDSDRPATFQDTLEMKYLERCIMETLRMYPPVPVIARQINEDLKLESGDYVVPKGATVIIGTFRLHRDPRTYPNPDTFDPDNFLPERSANRHYYSFVPFSAGPRSCVGRKYAMLKLKVILSTILRNFVVHADIQEKDYQLQADIILKRAEGFKIRLEPRKRNRTVVV